jgi:hypothetical protein
MVNTILNYFGYYKMPPRHAWQVMSEAPVSQLNEHGLASLDDWKSRRDNIITLWAAYDMAKPA